MPSTVPSIQHVINMYNGQVENLEAEFQRETYLPRASACGPCDCFVCVRAPSLSTSASSKKAPGTGQSFLHQPHSSSHPPTTGFPSQREKTPESRCVRDPISEFWIVSARRIRAKLAQGFSNICFPHIQGGLPLHV